MSCLILFGTLCNLPNPGIAQGVSDCEGHYLFFEDSLKMAAISNFAYVDTLRNTIKLNGNAPSIEEEVGELLGLVIDTTKNDFQFLNISESRLDSQYYYERYQQMYQGIPVSGGGYSNLIIHPDGHPCPRSVLLFPYFYTDIDVDTSNIYSESGVLQAFVDSINFQAHSVELLVEHNLLGQCNFDLVYKVHYSTDKSYIAWVDAHTLDILLVQSGFIGKNAPTEDYGQQNMEDSDKNQTETWLVSSDGRISTYDFNKSITIGNIMSIDVWNEDLIPTSPKANAWTISHAPGSVYQTHWFTIQIVDAYLSTLDIEFQQVLIGANANGESGETSPISSLTESHIAIGQMGTSPFSTFAEIDVIAHELGHAYLLTDYKLNYRGSAASLHEGIADMFGTFIESKIEGLDWQMGDNIPDPNGRDLENPQFDCFSDVEFSFDQWERSTPLSHWFFLNATECGGIDFAMNLVIDAINSISADGDYPDLMNSTLAVIGEIFGNCSSEMQCVADNWEEICVDTDYDYPRECTAFINGPYQICEEDNLGTFCIQNATGVTHHNFTLVGKNSTQFTTVAGMQGNRQSGINSCFKISLIPTLPYYPQFYDLFYWGAGGNNSYSARKRIKVADCLEDDLTCEEYFYPNSMISGSTELFQPENRKISKYKIYDITGRLIFSGPFDQELKFYDSGVYILVYFDQNGQWISSEKKAIIR